MNKTVCLLIATLSTFSAFAQPKVNVAKQINDAIGQYRNMIEDLKDSNAFPQSIAPDGSLSTMPDQWWCSGFFGGTLWYMYEYTKNPQLKKWANEWTVTLQRQQENKNTHDLGFMLYCSYGNGYRLTKDTQYRSVLLNGAESLSTRFNPKVGLLRSWNNFKGFKYPVIIDNMMNLEFLFWAAKESRNSKYRNICISHADKTLANHFRPDYSSYHVVCYDSVGHVLAKRTAQGYADNSAWARGQSWGLYGFTMMYRETNDRKYLDQAIHIAKFIMLHPHLPKDKIPYWDYDSPLIPNDARDASAAAVTASALLELSTYVDQKVGRFYLHFAEDIIKSLSGESYFASKGNHHFILKHATGNKPAQSEIDMPIIYADYYYIEALLRYDKIMKGIKS